jgi:hypothetical protein
MRCSGSHSLVAGCGCVATRIPKIGSGNPVKEIDVNGYKVDAFTYKVDAFTVLYK